MTAAARAFSPAHKVVVDAVTFLAASRRGDDDRLPLVFDALTRALPLCEATEWRELSRVMLAGSALLRAWDARRAGQSDWSSQWLAAMMDADHAVTSFAWWRMALSIDALFPQPELADG